MKTFKMANNVLLSTPYIPRALVNIDDKDLKPYAFNMDVGKYLKSPTQSAVHSTRFFEVQEWLVANVGNFKLGFWDGGYGGHWLLAVNDLQDFVAFKLAFAPL